MYYLFFGQDGSENTVLRINGTFPRLRLLNDMVNREHPRKIILLISQLLQGLRVGFEMKIEAITNKAMRCFRSHIIIDNIMENKFI